MCTYSILDTRHTEGKALGKCGLLARSRHDCSGKLDGTGRIQRLWILCRDLGWSKLWHWRKPQRAGLHGIGDAKVATRPCSVSSTLLIRLDVVLCCRAVCTFNGLQTSGHGSRKLARHARNGEPRGIVDHGAAWSSRYHLDEIGIFHVFAQPNFYC